MSAQNDESIFRYLLAEVVEGAVNSALAYEPMAKEHLRDHLGRVLRIKTTDPDWIVFVAICDDGIQLYADYEDFVDARITLPASLVTQTFLNNNKRPLTQMKEVRCSGDLDFIEDVLAIARQFNLWTLITRLFQSWMPEASNVSQLIEALKHNDPAWVDRLQHLPQLANETLMAVRDQGEMLYRQEQEIALVKAQLMADRRTNRISTLIGFCLILVAFLAHNGYLKVPAVENISLDTLILLILSMVILIPRFISGR